jgi:hypothetical protein
MDACAPALPLASQRLLRLGIPRLVVSGVQVYERGRGYAHRPPSTAAATASRRCHVQHYYYQFEDQDILLDREELS